MMSSHENFAAD